jgi:hypothetical protein
LQEVITLQHTVNEMPVYFDMPPIYTINDVGAESVVVRTSGNEKMLATNIDQAGRKQETITIYESELKEQLSKKKLSAYGIII